MNDRFFYLNSDQVPVGPLTLEELGKLVRAKVISKPSLVCREGESDWKPLSTVWADTLKSGISSTSVPRAVGTVTGENGQAPWQPLVAMILGLVALPGSCVPIAGLLLAGAGLVIGVRARRSAGATSRRQALVGVVCSIASIGVSLVVWAWTAAALSAANPGAAAIETVLNADLDLSKRAASLHRNDAGMRARYTAIEMQRIDLTRCPPDFRVAFQDHINAWSEAVPYIAANTPLAAFLEGLYSGYTQDYSALGWSQNQADLAAYQIHRTYQEVLRSAAAHGARVPVR